MAEELNQTNVINKITDKSYNDEKVDFGDNSESDESDIMITIGDIKTDLPSQRNKHAFSKEYKPPSRLIINFPTAAEIQQKLESAMNEKRQQFLQEETDQIEVSQWNHQNDTYLRNNEICDIPFAPPFSYSKGSHFDADIIYTQSYTKKRVSINKAAAEKLPPHIRDIVTSVAENNGYSQFAIQIPTVNFSTSATTTMNLTYPNVAAAATETALPEEYNPNIPPPTLPNSLKTANFEEKEQKNDNPITPVQALLRQYSNEDKGLPKSKVCYPDPKVCEQHRRHIQRNWRRNTNELDDNYRRPLQFFNSTIFATATKRRRSRSRSPHNQFQQLNQINFGRNKDDSKLKFSKSAANSDKIRFF